mgnify:FL=1
MLALEFWLEMRCSDPLKTHCRGSSSGLPTRRGTNPARPRHHRDFKEDSPYVLGTHSARVLEQSCICSHIDISFCANDASCTEIILALGPLTELDVAAAANPLALVLATIVAWWGGAGTSEESVIDVLSMVCISTHGFFCVTGR